MASLRQSGSVGSVARSRSGGSTVEARARSHPVLEPDQSIRPLGAPTISAATVRQMNVSSSAIEDVRSPVDRHSRCSRRDGALSRSSQHPY